VQRVLTALELEWRTPWPALLAWVEAERGRFVPWLAVCMGAGVAGYFARTTEPAWWAGLLACGIALGAVVLARHTLVARGVALCGLAAAMGFASAQAGTGRAAAGSYRGWRCAWVLEWQAISPGRRSLPGGPGC